jgi:tRNA(Ile)-lysidine synthase
LRPGRLVTAIRVALRDLKPSWRGDTIVVGLSGGPDSVALLDGLASLASAGGYTLVAAHLDHALRPDSAEDVVFCAGLCQRLGVAFRSGAADVRGRAQREHGGLEQAARRARYEFLHTVQREHAAAAIAVAHTRDDQAETVLLRLLRGSGRRGLAGMRAHTGDVLRPLLRASRDDVLAHLRARGLPWRDDPTNADRTLTRNRVRHELLPYLEERFNPRLREALARTATLLADEADVLSASAAVGLAQALRGGGDGIVLDRASLAAMPPALARIALRQVLEGAGGLRGVSAGHVEKILALVRSGAPRVRRLPLPGGREVVCRSRDVRVGPRTVPGRPAAYASATVSKSIEAAALPEPSGAAEVRS